MKPNTEIISYERELTSEQKAFWDTLTCIEKVYYFQLLREGADAEIVPYMFLVDFSVRVVINHFSAAPIYNRILFLFNSSSIKKLRVKSIILDRKNRPAQLQQMMSKFGELAVSLNTSQVKSFKDFNPSSVPPGKFVPGHAFMIAKRTEGAYLAWDEKGRFSETARYWKTDSDLVAIPEEEIHFAMNYGCEVSYARLLPSWADFNPHLRLKEYFTKVVKNRKSVIQAFKKLAEFKDHRQISKVTARQYGVYLRTNLWAQGQFFRRIILFLALPNFKNSSFSSLVLFLKDNLEIIDKINVEILKREMDDSVLFDTNMSVLFNELRRAIGVTYTEIQDCLRKRVAMVN